jgi:hypothetical protein
MVMKNRQAKVKMILDLFEDGTPLRKRIIDQALEKELPLEVKTRLQMLMSNTPGSFVDLVMGKN